MPYVIAGQDLGQIGIPFIESKTFDYYNVTTELTFHWFKQNIMCEDNPWICGRDRGDKKGKKFQNGGKQKAGSGSKKNRRKNKQTNNGASSSKAELRRHQQS